MFADKSTGGGEGINTWEAYELHFGAPRLQHYLTACRGDQRQAMELYRWNAAVSAVFWESLAYLEVALRNALDRRMSDRHARLHRDGHWIFDDARELGRDARGPSRHSQPYTDINEAKRRVLRNKKSLDAGQIISEVSFGFWHQLISKRQMFLWPDLASAFLHAPDRRPETLRDPVSRLREFRNRIGHHHRIWSEDVGGRYADLLDVAGYLDPQLRAFIDNRSRLPRLLQHRPHPDEPGSAT